MRRISSCDGLDDSRVLCGLCLEFSISAACPILSVSVRPCRVTTATKRPNEVHKPTDPHPFSTSYLIVTEFGVRTVLVMVLRVALQSSQMYSGGTRTCLLKELQSLSGMVLPYAWGRTCYRSPVAVVASLKKDMLEGFMSSSRVFATVSQYTETDSDCLIL